MLQKAAVVCLTLGLLGSGCPSGWVLEDSPTDEDLFAVFGVPSGEIFAVGAAGTVLVRQATQWRSLNSGVTEDLFGIWGTDAQHVVVVGDNCVALEYNGEVEPGQQGGEAPSPMRALSVETCSDFRAIDGQTATSALVVGDGRLHWYNGQQLVNGGSFDQRLLGVSLPGEGNFFIAGEAGFFARNDGERWHTTEISICPVDRVDGQCPMEAMKPILWDVWMGRGDEGWVVGTFGGVWRYPPPGEGLWESLETGIDDELRSVHGRDLTDADAETEAYAVGLGGGVLRLRGDEVHRSSIGTNEDLYGVWLSADGSHVYAVGAGGTIAHLIR